LPCSSSCCSIFWRKSGHSSALPHSVMYCFLILLLACRWFMSDFLSIRTLLPSRSFRFGCQRWNAGNLALLSGSSWWASATILLCVCVCACVR
jgi:hypothetical protein